MTREEVIEDFKRSNEQAKVRLEVEKMRMDMDEVKELEFYIERDEMAIKALEQEPCEDAVSRKEIINYIRKLACDLSYWSVTDEVVKDIEALPPVTPKPKTGHWIWCVGSHKCSNCEEYTCFSHKELLRYCPNCGARMIEPQERSEKK